jgi:small subunit ribosomal protein S6
VHTYEVMYIVKPIEETAFETIVKKFDDLLAANGGTVEKTDRWGKKRLAYEIKDFVDGIYVLVTFQGDGKTVKELDRVMKITDEILRHMIIKKGE